MAWSASHKLRRASAIVVANAQVRISLGYFDLVFLSSEPTVKRPVQHVDCFSSSRMAYITYV